MAGLAGENSDNPADPGLLQMVCATRVLGSTTSTAWRPLRVHLNFFLRPFIYRFQADPSCSESVPKVRGVRRRHGPAFEIKVAHSPQDGFAKLLSARADVCQSLMQSATNWINRTIDCRMFWSACRRLEGYWHQ